MLNCKNGTVTAGGVTMEYIRFGTGPKNLIMLPGLGDGLRTMKGTALPMGLMYRLFTKDFTVWAFSAGEISFRKAIPPGIWPGIRSWLWTPWESERPRYWVFPWAA